MKEYLLLFWNESGDGHYQVKPEEMKAAMAAWEAWIGEIALQGKLVSTKPVAYEGTVISQEGKHESPAIKAGELVTGYMICKADSSAEVERWSQTCPILQHPKGSVEIREFLPFEL